METTGSAASEDRHLSGKDPVDMAICLVMLVLHPLMLQNPMVTLGGGAVVSSFAFGAIHSACGHCVLETSSRFVVVCGCCAGDGVVL